MSASSSSSPTVPTVTDPASLSYLAWFDKTLDNVPVVAAANNSVDLALKGLFLITPQWMIESTAYTKYIDEKRWTKCVGCSALGFIYTTFFEDPAAIAANAQKETPQSSVRESDSTELRDLLKSADTAMNLATFQMYQIAAKSYQIAADQLHEADSERAKELEQLRDQANDQIKKITEQRDRDAVLLIAQGAAALKSTDPQIACCADSLFVNAYRLVEESNPQKAASIKNLIKNSQANYLQPKEEQQARQLFTLGVEALKSLDPEVVKQAVTHFQNAADTMRTSNAKIADFMMKMHDSAAAEVKRLEKAATIDEEPTLGNQPPEQGYFIGVDQSTKVEEEVGPFAEAALNEATVKEMTQKVVAFIAQGDDFHDDREFDNAISYYAMAIEVVNNLPKPCDQKFDEFLKLAESRKENSKEALKLSQIADGNDDDDGKMSGADTPIVGRSAPKDSLYEVDFTMGRGGSFAENWMYGDHPPESVEVDLVTPLNQNLKMGLIPQDPVDNSGANGNMKKRFINWIGSLRKK